MGRVCYGPSLSWAEFVMGRVVQLPKKQLGWVSIPVCMQVTLKDDLDYRNTESRQIDPWPVFPVCNYNPVFTVFFEIKQKERKITGDYV